MFAFEPPPAPASAAIVALRPPPARDVKIALWQLRAPVDVVWRRVTDIDRWPRWWPQIRGVQPGPAARWSRRVLLRTGLQREIWLQVRRAWLREPWTLHVDVGGMLSGHCVWECEPLADSTRVLVSWTAKRRRALQPVLAARRGAVYERLHRLLMRAACTGLAASLDAEVIENCTMPARRATVVSSRKRPSGCCAAGHRHAPSGRDAPAIAAPP